MSSKPSPGFGVQRGGKPILEAGLKGTISTGIRYTYQIRNVVPFFEEYDAMVKAGYNTTEWNNLEYMTKVEAVAYQRLKKLIGLHENDAVQTYHERMTRRKKVGRPRRRR